MCHLPPDQTSQTDKHPAEPGGLYVLLGLQLRARSDVGVDIPGGGKEDKDEGVYKIVFVEIVLT